MAETRTGPLLFAHIGDLHIEAADPQALADFRTIVAEIRCELGEIDFVVLPGDVANNGRIDEYACVAPELAKLADVHVITGDHDMAAGSLANFYATLGVPRLPYARDHGGVRCLFLDMCGPGRGGLDFRIGAGQLKWLKAQLEEAAKDQRFAVFMHTYPADITDPRERAAAAALLADPRVRLVDIGHTHYNELANDGRKIFAATRSTGQIEEDKGRVGYAIAAIDGHVVSWRFRRLGERRPFVLITAPADRRLAIEAADPDQRPKKTCEVRATLLSRCVATCSCSLDGGAPQPMRTEDGRHFTCTVALPKGGTGRRSILVEAADDAGEVGWEAVELACEEDFRRPREADGSDADRIGRWIDRGILGSQLGPNRNGRDW